MDVDHYEGGSARGLANAQLNTSGRRQNIEPYGMDFNWTLIGGNVGAHCPEYQTAYGSPHMPAVKGYTVLNNKVMTSLDGATANPMGLTVTDSAQINWARADKGLYNVADGSANTTTWGADASYTTNATKVLYAETGTNAIQRKPLVRTWHTISQYQPEADKMSDPEQRDRDMYFVDTEGDPRQLNVHVENRYWLNDQPLTWQNTIDGNWGHTGVQNSKHANNYATDGGQKGTLVLPVVTVVLPYGIAPYDSETGQPYTGDGTTVEVKANDWGLSEQHSVDASNYSGANEAAASLDAATRAAQWKVTSTFEDVTTDSGVKEQRYVVRFEPTASGLNEAEDLLTAIENNGLDIFKLNIVTYNEPKLGLDPVMLRSYDNVRTYVTSKMIGYKFLTDQSIKLKNVNDGSYDALHMPESAKQAQNPFYVGAPMALTMEENRAVEMYRYNHNNGWGYWVPAVNAYKGYAQDLRLDSTYNTYKDFDDNGDTYRNWGAYYNEITYAKPAWLPTSRMVTPLAGNGNNRNNKPLSTVVHSYWNGAYTSVTQTPKNTTMDRGANTTEKVPTNSFIGSQRHLHRGRGHGAPCPAAPTTTRCWAFPWPTAACW